MLQCSNALHMYLLKAVAATSGLVGLDSGRNRYVEQEVGVVNGSAVEFAQQRA